MLVLRRLSPGGLPLFAVPPEEEAGHPLSGFGAMGRLTGSPLARHSMAAMQAAAAQATMAAQVAALEQLRDKLEAGEPPEKKMALPAEEHQRLIQRALQHNLLAMTAQMPMNIRINNQGRATRQAGGWAGRWAGSGRAETWSAVNGLDSYSAFLTSGHSKRFTILPNIHPFMHTFTHSHTDGSVTHAGRQPARREKSGLEASRSGTPRNSARRSQGSN